MPDNPNDPNQWLANMFAAGQEWMKPFLASGGDAKAEDVPKPAASEPANPYAQLLAASFGFAEMQKNYMRQVAEMWMGVTKSAAPLPSGDSARFTGATIRVSEPTLARNSPNAW